MPSITTTSAPVRSRAATGQDDAAERSVPRRLGSDPSAEVPADDLRVWRLHLAARDGDRVARAALVDEYGAFARSLARRAWRGGEPLEDLVQVALEALLLAIDRFDPDRGLPFVAFARPTVMGSLKRYYRDAGWAIRVPRRVHDIAGPVRHAADLLQQDLGRPPTPSEIADLLDLPSGDVVDALRAVAARAVQSLDTPDGARSREPASTESGYRRVEDHQALASGFERLTAEQRHVIERYYIDGSSQTVIGAELGRSQMYVSRALRQAINQLRAAL